MAIPSFSEQAIVHGIATGLRPRNDVVTLGWCFWIGWVVDGAWAGDS